MKLDNIHPNTKVILYSEYHNTKVQKSEIRVYVYNPEDNEFNNVTYELADKFKLKTSLDGIIQLSKPLNYLKQDIVDMVNDKHGYSNIKLSVHNNSKDFLIDMQDFKRELSKSARFKNNKNDIIEILKGNGGELKYVNTDYRDDKEIVLEAVKNNSMALQYASDRLKELIGNQDPILVLESMVTQEKLGTKIIPSVNLKSLSEVREEKGMARKNKI